MATIIADHGSDRRNYPLNCWWVAAFADEVGRAPMSRWLLDTPVVLYRTEAGKIVALEDRCPHRQAPLSMGSIQGDAIECGYHGFQFGADGRCVRVPSMSSPPPIRVQTYPVREEGPLVWIYLGDRDRIDDVPPPPEFPWMTDPSYAIRKGTMHIAANYLLLKENVLDLTHLGYVHAASFQITDWVNPPIVTTEGDTVEYRQEFVRSPLAPGYALSLGLEPGTPWNRVGTGKSISPASHESMVAFFDPDNPQHCNGRNYFAHLATPIDMRSMHYFYVVGRNFGRDDDLMDKFAEILVHGFKEDEAVLMKVQEMLSRTPRRGSTGERSVKADAAGIEARRAVERWMARETIHD